jgi:hypothetical protein
MRSRLSVEGHSRQKYSASKFVVFEEIERLHPPQIAAFGRTIHRFMGESHNQKGQVVCGFVTRFKTAANARRCAEVMKAVWESGKRNRYNYTVLKQSV